MAIAHEQKKRIKGHNETFPSPLPSHRVDEVKQKLVYARWFLAISILFTGAVMAIWVGLTPLRELGELLGDQAKVSAYLQSFGAWGPLALGIIQFLQVIIVVIPGHVFLIAAGYVYGFPLGFALNLVYVVVASQLAFLFSRWAGRPLVENLVPVESLNRWYKIGEERGFLFFTVAFLLPVFPTDLMNLVAGLTGISSRRFFAANVLGRLPGVIMLTLIGSHGLDLSTTSWVVMGMIVASFYVLGRYVVRKMERP